MGTVWVLIMVFGGTTNVSGMEVVQQEFTSQENCERARVVLATTKTDVGWPLVRAHGCFKK